MTDAPAGYRCPACGDWTPATGAWRPFCSERCKMIDLGHWLAGRYKVPGREDDAADVPAPRTDDDDDAR